MNSKIIAAIYFIWGLICEFIVVAAAITMKQNLSYMIRSGIDSPENFLALFITFFFLLGILCFFIGKGLWKQKPVAEKAATTVSIIIIVATLAMGIIGYVDEMTYVLIVVFHLLMLVTINFNKIFKRNERTKSRKL